MEERITCINPSPESYRAYRVDQLVHPRVRRFVLSGAGSVVCASGIVSLGVRMIRALESSVSLKTILIAQKIPLDRVEGICAIAASIFFLFLFLEFYYISHLISSDTWAHQDRRYALSPEAARVLFKTRLLSESSLVLREFWNGFFSSPYADMFFVRLGIRSEDFQKGLIYPRATESISAEDFVSALCVRADAHASREILLADLFAVLYERDPLSAKLFFDYTITREDLLSVIEWVEYTYASARLKRAWWTKENFSRAPGIGHSVSFGFTYILDQYSRELSMTSVPFFRETRKKEVEAIEEVLSRSYEANVLLVGEEGVGKHAILEGLGEHIRSGRALPTLEYKRVVVLDYTSIIAVTKSKGLFEEMMIRIMNETVAAGNVILVIEDFPSFVASCAQLGVDSISLLEPYLRGAHIQVVALASRQAFDRDLEPDGRVMKLFQKIDIEEPSLERSLRMLEDAALLVEHLSGKIFTFQAIRMALSLADRFITEGVMPEKAIDLLSEAASFVPKDHVYIFPADVEHVVQSRTHIPTAAAKKEEQEKLLNLEDVLHERLINQAHAVRVIADALRRARSGLKSTTRPIGSFLFLGPTGVGKTETAKALADIYFGGGEAMIRFDMSEYQSSEGVEKLIGARDSKTPGILAARLRERPFSLLLFDEFEKASRDVHNLFLQILDEGFFSDGVGRRVSTRETMIIATSNAGANLIWDLIKEGKDPSEINGTVVDEIRRANIFNPELLNRFDAMVVYHPLTKEQLQEVAMLLLLELKKRLKEQEIDFEPSPELAEKVVEIGYDPVFGARPMRRAIQDHVEQVIAKKILEGSLKRGDTFRFSKEEIIGL